MSWESNRKECVNALQAVLFEHDPADCIFHREWQAGEYLGEAKSLLEDYGGRVRDTADLAKAVGWVMDYHFTAGVVPCPDDFSAPPGYATPKHGTYVFAPDEPQIIALWAVFEKHGQTRAQFDKWLNGEPEE